MEPSGLSGSVVCSAARSSDQLRVRRVATMVAGALHLPLDPGVADVEDEVLASLAGSSATAMLVVADDAAGVARRLLGRLDCPALVVPSRAGGPRPRTVIALVRHGATAAAVAVYAGALALALRAELRIAHAVELPREREPVDRLLLRSARLAPSGVDLRLHSLGAPKQSSIPAMVRHHDPALVVSGRPCRSGSLLRSLLDGTAAPVLVAPAGGARTAARRAA